MMKLWTLGVAGFMLLASAETPPPAKPAPMPQEIQQDGKGMGDMCHRKGMGDKSMRGGMMCNHEKSSLVATSDGGVVILCGNRLMKFDKNLKKVSEIELACGKEDEATQAK